MLKTHKLLSLRVTYSNGAPLPRASRVGVKAKNLAKFRRARNKDYHVGNLGTCGQSQTIVIYDSRVVLEVNSVSGTTLGS